MSLTTDGTQLTMPVVPAGSYGGGNGMGWGGDSAWQKSATLCGDAH